MLKIPITYRSAITVMHNWKLNPLELYAFIITTPDFPAYIITGGTNITPFIPPAKGDIVVEKIVPSLLFKHKDIIRIENQCELDSDKGDTTGVKADRNKTSPKILKMINDVGPEVERLYKTIKKIGFSGRKKTACEQYRDAVLEFFHECRKEFTMVKESYLSDWTLYSFRDGHQKGDFIGRLLQAIANDLDLGVGNYQELYKIYKSTKRLQ